MFIAFNGEEQRLYGSTHYVNNPIYPLENSVLINLDMVGSKNVIPLTIGGSRHAFSNQLYDMARELGVESEAGNAVISPGFIDLDALGDIDHALIDNEIPTDQKHHFSWSEEYFQEDRKEWMSDEEEAFKSLYAYSQLIMNGITTAMPITSVNYKKCGETYEEKPFFLRHSKE